MFTNDSRTENFLTAIGVKFEYVNGLRLPDDFATGWNTENIGRPVAVREDAVIEYAALMEAGSAAPAPILSRTERGLRVLDGVQRLSAAELNQTRRTPWLQSASSPTRGCKAVQSLLNGHDDARLRFSSSSGG